MEFKCFITNFDLLQKHFSENQPKVESYLSLCGQYLFKELFTKLEQSQTVTCHLEIIDSPKMISINGQYRNKPKNTDVLSFPIFDDLRNQFYDHTGFELIELGDIYICDEVLLEQAKEFELSALEEFIQLYIHALLHLIGFDHERSSKEEKEMELWEKKVFQVFAKSYRKVE